MKHAIENDPFRRSRLSLSLKGKLFILAIILHVAPIWMFAYFATQDGPSHLHNSAVMLDALTGGAPVFQQYYQVQPNLGGNVVSQVLLMGLQSVAPSWVADKVILSLYVVLLALGFWYATGSVRSDPGWLAFLIFPFIYNAWIHMGLYNFCMGMALFLFVMGYFLRHRGHFGGRKTAYLTLLFLLLYSAHITAFGAATLVTGILALFDMLQDWRNVDRRERGR